MTDTPTDDRFPFLGESSFVRPPVLSRESAWNGHTPFAAWLVAVSRPKVLVELGTHAGVSFFAFCESAQRSGIDTQLHAVDTWEGDEHSGFYDESVYANVERINAGYRGLSHLHRRTFDEAVEDFDDGVVDLLHIDGLHTYEAVRHDFETWLPKLSRSAVVVLHDTDERRGDFGVYRFFEELAERYPTFEFLHEHGLGVVGVGSDLPPSVAELLGLEDSDERVEWVREAYSTLGGRWSLEVALGVADETTGQLRDALERRDSTIEDLRSALDRRAASVADLERAVARRDDTLRQQQAAIARRDARIEGLELDRERTLAVVVEKDRELVNARDELARIEGELSAERSDYERLRHRRSVRISLAIAEVFRPLFKVVRRIRKGPPPTMRHKPDGSSDTGTSSKETSIAEDVDATPVLFPEVPTTDPGNAADLPLTVIIPVYNAPDQLERCLRSVLRNSTGDATLLIVDDASTDGRIAPMLRSYEATDGVRVLTNDVNLGFTRTVNRGFESTVGDVVVLNSDTEVPPGWLDRLRYAASAVPNAGTITPLSDNAGAFSAPEMGQHNAVPLWLTRDEVGTAIAGSTNRSYPHTPTGNGYCMFVRRSCLDDVGVFDAEAFPRGYGEENDWCMRALDKGWVHIVDGSTYIFHERSSSFGDEKHELMRSGRAVLDERYPEYTDLVRSFVSSAEMQLARSQVGDAFKVGESARRKLPRVLFLLHGAGGGTPATTRDLMEGLDGRYEPFLLVSNGKVLRLVRYDGSSHEEVDRWVLATPIEVQDVTNREYRAIVGRILVGLDIDVLHIRHLIGHTFEAAEVARGLGVPVALSFHDFYYVCPTVQLLDERGKFCGGICTDGQGVCPIPTPWLDDVPHLKHNWVYEWRDRSKALFANVDRFVTTSESCRQVYLDTFPELAGRPFTIIEHGRDLDLVAEPVGVLPVSDEAIRILLAGHIAPHKGSDFVRALLAVGGRRAVEIHVLGTVADDLAGSVVEHGTYERDEFVERARQIRPAFVGLFSTTAESFSHVLTESWGAGIPVLASNLGALAERVEAHGGGWIIDIDDPIGALDIIESIAADRADYEQRRDEAVRNGRDSHTVEEMAFEYATVYEQMRRSRRSFPIEAPDEVADAPLRVGVFLPGGPRPNYPPSAHVRVLNRLGSGDVARRVVSRVVDTHRFNSAYASGQFDVVVVQRNAIDRDALDGFLGRCASDGIGIVVDLDDDLLSDDPEWKERSHYAPYRESLLAVLEAADAVTVSTEPLASRLLERGVDATVLVNSIDRGLWLEGMMSDDVPQEVTTGRPSLAFIGGPSHGDDLAMIGTSIAEVVARTPGGVDVVTIGGLTGDDHLPWIERLDIPSESRHYPDFARWVASHRGRFQVGLAPLQPTPLNRSKSDLRFLEYAVLGIPGVYSQSEAFSTVEDGVTGLVVEDSVGAWRDAVLSLLADEELRATIRSNAFEYVVRERLLDQQADEYVALLRLAASG